jgi:hypothetical protein
MPELEPLQVSDRVMAMMGSKCGLMRYTVVDGSGKALEAGEYASEAAHLKSVTGRRRTPGGAATMYRGDLLPKVERACCCERREGLREKWVEALVGLGRRCEARNDPAEAEVWYLRVLEVDDL